LSVWTTVVSRVGTRVASRADPWAVSLVVSMVDLKERCLAASLVVSMVAYLADGRGDPLAAKRAASMEQLKVVR